ncbi:hypothetical protein HOY82DRAFT_646935, partial [Tuber indicum]
MLAAMMARQQSDGTRHSEGGTSHGVPYFGTDTPVVIKQPKWKTQGKRSSSDQPPNLARDVAKYSSNIALGMLSSMVNSATLLANTFQLPETAIDHLRDASKRFPENTDARAVCCILENKKKWFSTARPGDYLATDHTLELNIFEESCGSTLESPSTPSTIASSPTTQSSPSSEPTSHSPGSCSNWGPNCPSSLDLPGGNHFDNLYAMHPPHTPSSYLFLLQNGEGNCEEAVCPSPSCLNSISQASSPSGKVSPVASVIHSMGPELGQVELANLISEVPTGDGAAALDSCPLIPNSLGGLGDIGETLGGSSDERNKIDGWNKHFRRTSSQGTAPTARSARRKADDSSGASGRPPTKKAKGLHGEAKPIRAGDDCRRDGTDKSVKRTKQMTKEEKGKNFFQPNRYVLH